jgi:proteic killer suppression protein
MIRSFDHGGLGRFWTTGSRAGIPAEMANRLRIRLSVLDAATQIGDLDKPGYALHPLKGDRKGEWAIRVTGNWRLVFRMDKPGEIASVNLEDYH